MKKLFIPTFFLIVTLGATTLLFATPADDSFNSGKKYYDQFLYEQAVSSFQEAVSSEATYWEAYQMLAYSYYKLGNRSSALEAANKSLLIHSDNQELRQFVADHLQKAEMPNAPGEHAIHGASEASAAETKVENSLYINLGGSLPMSPANFTSDQSLGYNGGIGFGIGITKVFQVVLDANADTFALNTNSSLFSGMTVSGGQTRLFTFLANGRIHLIPENNSVIPYAIGGVGMGLLANDDLTLTNSGVATVFPGSSKSYVAARVGLGLALKLSPYASLFFEPNGVLIFSGNSTSGGQDLLFGSFRVGGKFNL